MTIRVHLFIPILTSDMTRQTLIALLGRTHVYIGHREIAVFPPANRFLGLTSLRLHICFFEDILRIG